MTPNRLNREAPWQDAAPGHQFVARAAKTLPIGKRTRSSENLVAHSGTTASARSRAAGKRHKGSRKSHPDASGKTRSTGRLLSASSNASRAPLGSDSEDSLWNPSGILSSTAARVRLKQRHSPTAKTKNGRPQLWTPSAPKPGRRRRQSQPAAWGQLAYQLRPGDRSRHHREILHSHQVLRTGPES